MQSDEVRAFKNELSNYDFYRKRVEALNELIEICYHSLGGLHSPDFQIIPVHSPADLEKRDRLYAEIDKHKSNLEKATRKTEYSVPLLDYEIAFLKNSVYIEIG